MRDNTQYFHVNWIDGMKINKNLFINQDDAIRNDLHDVASFSISPIKYGVLPGQVVGQNSFNVKISIDNQDNLRVSLLSCQAVTSGGIPINVSAALKTGFNETDGTPSITYHLTQSLNESVYWVVLVVNPFERQPAGNLIVNETPPRFPYVLPVYTLQVVSDIQYKQFATHPYALVIGKVLVKGSGFVVDENYLPPCFTVSAHPALVQLYSDLEAYLNKIEVSCSKIIRKINQRKQKNELSEMILFLCDRTLLNIAQVINQFRWTTIHESPAYMLAAVSGIARVIKNTIDLNIDSGKDLLVTYFTEWCDPKQGEIEKILINMANERYDNNDINKSIVVVIAFVNLINELFQTLSNLEFIGKRKEGYVVDEKVLEPAELQKPKVSSRFITR